MSHCDFVAVGVTSYNVNAKSDLRGCEIVMSVCKPFCDGTLCPICANCDIWENSASSRSPWTRLALISLVVFFCNQVTKIYQISTRLYSWNYFNWLSKSSDRDKFYFHSRTWIKLNVINIFWKVKEYLNAISWIFKHMLNFLTSFIHLVLNTNLFPMENSNKVYCLKLSI